MKYPACNRRAALVATTSDPRCRSFSGCAAARAAAAGTLETGWKGRLRKMFGGAETSQGGVLAKNFTSAYFALERRPGRAPGGVMAARGGGKPAAVEASRYLGVGLTWALSTLLFLWLGTLVDGWLGTRPWLTLLGAFVGASAGFYYMYYHLVVRPRQSHDDAGEGRP
jgi:hypothetical protein